MAEAAGQRAPRQALAGGAGWLGARESALARADTHQRPPPDRRPPLEPSPPRSTPRGWLDRTEFPGDEKPPYSLPASAAPGVAATLSDMPYPSDIASVRGEVPTPGVFGMLPGEPRGEVISEMPSSGWEGRGGRVGDDIAPGPPAAPAAQVGIGSGLRAPPPSEFTGALAIQILISTLGDKLYNR